MFKKRGIPIKNEVLIILSGIKSQREQLEKKLLDTFQNYPKKVVMVNGKIENAQTKTVLGNITIYNYLLSKELEVEINQSDLIICRSGYSSIMDLAILEKKAFFIPTKNQTEQEYLANYLEATRQAPFCKLKNFNLALLKEVKKYKGLSSKDTGLNKYLLRLFERK